MGGTPGGNVGEPFNVPMTAHFIGGCVIGATPADGVVDPYHRVHGHPGLHVVDGSTISANLGVNPSLTITAQAERAMALWPNRGEPDPRPEPGAPYARLDPVPPADPAVPADRSRRPRLTAIRGFWLRDPWLLVARSVAGGCAVRGLWPGPGMAAGPTGEGDGQAREPAGCDQPGPRPGRERRDWVLPAPTTPVHVGYAAMWELFHHRAPIG